MGGPTVCFGCFVCVMIAFWVISCNQRDLSLSTAPQGHVNHYLINYSSFLKHTQALDPNATKTFWCNHVEIEKCQVLSNCSAKC